jgi:hypothetical protein
MSFHQIPSDHQLYMSPGSARNGSFGRNDPGHARMRARRMSLASDHREKICFSLRTEGRYNVVGSMDMSTPVTRGELREELAQLEQRLEQKFEQRLDQRLAHFATKAELEVWGGALLARIESGEQRMIERMESLEQRLLMELARHTRAITESVSMQISVIDEKYADLPPRVSRLEDEVFAPERR